MSSPLAQVIAEANRPAPAPTPSTIAPTNVAGIYNNYAQQQEQQYKDQLAQNNAMWGGLATLGGAGISAFGPGIFSGIKGLNFGQRLFGGGSPSGYGT